jgi:hypothetical protein
MLEKATVRFVAHGKRICSDYSNIKDWVRVVILLENEYK